MTHQCDPRPQARVLKLWWLLVFSQWHTECFFIRTSKTHARSGMHAPERAVLQLTFPQAGGSDSIAPFLSRTSLTALSALLTRLEHVDHLSLSKAIWLPRRRQRKLQFESDVEWLALVSATVRAFGELSELSAFEMMFSFSTICHKLLQCVIHVRNLGL